MSIQNQTETREREYAGDSMDQDEIVVNDDDFEPVTQEVRPSVLVTAAPSGNGATASAAAGDQSPERGPNYLEAEDSAQANERWQRIQTDFVDDPRKSVAEAHELVGELTQRIVDAFAKERSDLERQWSEGDSVSTEDLRVCLQRYRTFFSRLLPSANGASAGR